jgi:hypothetical protein
VCVNQTRVLVCVEANPVSSSRHNTKTQILDNMEVDGMDIKDEKPKGKLEKETENYNTVSVVSSEFFKKDVMKNLLRDKLAESRKLFHSTRRTQSHD